ncbi:hypothetical protein K402DRAFT_392654 [Aulographum hederae CBS 113979]|uniref:DUF1330 domain-containing protein n=1 Tax=Aulographum hederae CBS 113979 TaxID=1176131 RepID=A0A6G1H2Z8_9PEZI|nr:hypothetical protein K402DRAFT_392654 [Aulographum hederae CBS 113979]
MPVCTLHLLSLTVPLQAFLQTLSTLPEKPILTAKVIRWIIEPTSTNLSPLLSEQWHLFLILPGSSLSLPAPLQKHTKAHFTIAAGIPSRILSAFPDKNKSLLHPPPGSIPPLTGALDKPKVASSTKDLELSPDLQSWIRIFGEQEGRSAVSMLNLLSFLPQKKASYLQYGAAFAKSIGSRRGGDAKIVGTVVSVEGKGKEESNRLWDEVAVAHYPSIWHFADMLASEDYQEVNREFRVPALRDTCILCTSEVGVGELAGGAGSAKL